MKWQSVVPDVVTYNALISTCGKGASNQPKRALKLFQAMRQQLLVPNIITYGALISACQKGKQLE